MKGSRIKIGQVLIVGDVKVKVYREPNQRNTSYFLGEVIKEGKYRGNGYGVGEIDLFPNEDAYPDNVTIDLSDLAGIYTIDQSKDLLEKIKKRVEKAKSGLD